MRILSAEQGRALDEMTVISQKIRSQDLMERASQAFVEVFNRRFPNRDRPVLIFAGTGNNGGDGLVIARLLHNLSYNVRVIQLMIGQRSPDNSVNWDRLWNLSVKRDELWEGQELPVPHDNVILIDAIFGTGLNRPVTGYWAELFDHLNQQQVYRVAVDVPSGMYTDKASDGIILRADLTISLGYPNLALFAPSNAANCGEFLYAPFSLSSPELVKDFGQYAQQNFLNTAAEMKKLLKLRHSNDHKGTFGHALLVAGAFGKMGAAVIAGRAVLRAGAGLLTCHIPRNGYDIMQISFPEAMCEVDAHRYHTTEVGNTDSYRTIGIGPGIGQDPLTARAMRDLIHHYDRPMVVDADALNLISKEPGLLELLPDNSIITPHPKEFARLFGEAKDDWARWQVQREVAKSKGLIVLLKTGYTSIALPDGSLFFNPTGNPGMGTAGTGDALTGVLTGLLAQGYAPADAARLGVYLHGLAGDIAAERLGQEFLLAEDVVNHLGRAFKALRQQTHKLANPEPLGEE
ncbi:NAD(P)H-hydrate dehydratase [Neolewinella agarilytica]|uniref:Bifunctional NAD(P)H-hydrate repair enzyme n=1 Tax=Neolewinella agarilytica TaxID=478744 RepID=A0A1H8ZRN4_9BACT|nr:NAD(P)H-hydrate dehydratase [Neolewinella agarilytica]SEP67004.1 NAD(P)H-hydrate epimerase [Neolewinella agarilytica]